MDKIICLVGASGSGKTSIAKELEKLGYNIIYSYTTRDEREPGEWGHTFIDNYTYSKDKEGSLDGISIISKKYENGVKQIFKQDMIAYFEGYNSIYFATKDQYQGKGTSIYIVDNKGANQVKENVKDAEVITIYLQADMSSRFPRLIRRGDSRESILSRIEDDDELFKIVKCDYVVDGNFCIEDVLKCLLEVIN